MIATPKKINTRDRILNATEALILEKGLSATSLIDICKQASTTKGGFFHYFPSKEALAFEVTERFSSKMNMAFMSGGYQTIKDPVAKLFGFLNHQIKNAKNPNFTRGCVIGIIGQEKGLQNPAYRELVMKCFTPGYELMLNLIERAKRSRPHLDHINSRNITQMWLCLLQGSLVMIRSSGNQDLLQDNLEEYKNYLQSLFRINQTRI